MADIGLYELNISGTIYLIDLILTSNRTISMTFNHVVTLISSRQRRTLITLNINMEAPTYQYSKKREERLLNASVQRRQRVRPRRSWVTLRPDWSPPQQWRPCFHTVPIRTGERCQALRV